MRLAISATLGGLLVAFVSPAADPKGDAVTKEQIEADLKLVPKVFGDTRVIEAGTQPYIEFALVNTSKTRTHKVVKPGDGSSDGRRDPWVHVTAEQRTVEGGWAAMRGHVPAGCGLFDWDWLKDVIELKPGEELKLTDWYHPSEFEFQYPGKVWLTGHYSYRDAVLASAVLAHHLQDSRRSCGRGVTSRCRVCRGRHSSVCRLPKSGNRPRLAPDLRL